MNEKELLSQLHNLKNIRPDHQWKNDNREILLSQIGSGEALKPVSFMRSIMNVFAWRNMEWATQPAGVMSIIILLLLGGSAVSVMASRNAMPGDSFYIAKIISEKTKQAVTFDETEKVKLGIEFASNRTKEIVQVLNENNNGDNTANLENDFKKEIKSVKSRLGKINTGLTAKKIENNNKESDNEQVFSADSGKDKNGVQVSGGAVATSIKPEVSEPADSPTKALEDAEKLFDQKDYQGTLDKLEEANAIIDNKETENSNIGTTATGTAPMAETDAVSTTTEETSTATSTE